MGRFPVRRSVPSARGSGMDALGTGAARGRCAGDTEPVTDVYSIWIFNSLKNKSSRGNIKERMTHSKKKKERIKHVC